MSPWQPLPDDLDPAMRSLIVRLRELKDELGVSLAALERKTAYSRSSWERYLNGRTFPPQQAVETLGALSGAEREQLLALWELAEQSRQQPPVPASTVPVPEAVPRFRFRRQWMLAAAGVAVLAIASTAVLLTSRGSSAPSVPMSPAGYACEYTMRDGSGYAGHSDTSDRLVMLHIANHDVVEVQCLLKRHGLDPGRVDGIFGERTEAAVKQLQHQAGVPADGKVGPQTWPLLRG